MGPERSLSAKGKCGKARIKHGERLSVWIHGSRYRYKICVCETDAYIYILPSSVNSKKA